MGPKRAINIQMSDMKESLLNALPSRETSEEDLNTKRNIIVPKIDVHPPTSGRSSLVKSELSMTEKYDSGMIKKSDSITEKRTESVTGPKKSNSLIRTRKPESIPTRQKTETAETKEVKKTTNLSLSSGKTSSLMKTPSLTTGKKTPTAPNKPEKNYGISSTAAPTKEPNLPKSEKSSTTTDKKTSGSSKNKEGDGKGKELKKSGRDSRSSFKKAISRVHSYVNEGFFSPAEIRRLGKRFNKLDTDHSGSLTVDEFLSLNSITNNSLVERVIDIFDNDGNSELNFDEFIRGVSTFCEYTKREDKMRFAFRIYDMDNDGFISSGELFQVLKLMVGDNLGNAQLQMLVDKAIVYFDQDGDGKISFEEFNAVVGKIHLEKTMQIDSV